MSDYTQTPGSISWHSGPQPLRSLSGSACFTDGAGGPSISYVQCLCSPSLPPPPTPAQLHPSSPEPISLSSTPVGGVLLLGGSCPAGQNAEHSFGAPAFRVDILISASPPTLLLSRFPPLLHLLLLPLLPPPPCFHPLLFSFPLPSLSPSVVVDWVSECLWQLCVVCNRAERLV